MPYSSAAGSVSWYNVTSKIVAGNEFNIVNSNYNASIWFNYDNLNGRGDDTSFVSSYEFGNAKHGYAPVRAAAFIVNGYDSSYVLKSNGIELESSLDVNSAKYVTSPFASYNTDTITDSTTSDSLYKADNGTLYPVFHLTTWGGNSDWSDTLYFSGYGKWGGTELATQYNAISDVRVKIRKYNQTRNGWGDWTEFITSGNIGSQSVAYASNADKLDSLDSTEFIRIVNKNGDDTYNANNMTQSNTLYISGGDMYITAPAWSNFPVNRPNGSMAMYHLNEGSYQRQILSVYNDIHLFTRRNNYNGGVVWGDWYKIAYTTDTVAGATVAGTSDYLKVFGQTAEDSCIPDANDKFGLYYAYPCNAAGGDSYIMTMGTGGYWTQLAIDVDKTYKMSLRQKTASAGWNDWVNILTGNNSYVDSSGNGIINGSTITNAATVGGYYPSSFFKTGTDFLVGSLSFSKDQWNAVFSMESTGGAARSCLVTFECHFSSTVICKTFHITSSLSGGIIIREFYAPYYSSPGQIMVRAGSSGSYYPNTRIDVKCGSGVNGTLRYKVILLCPGTLTAETGTNVSALSYSVEYTACNIEEAKVHYASSADDSSNLGGYAASNYYRISTTSSSSVASLALASYSSIYIARSSNETMSFASTPAEGKECHIVIYNSGSSNITITLPSSYRRNVSSITIASSAFGEVNVMTINSIVHIRAV